MSPRLSDLPAGMTVSRGRAAAGRAGTGRRPGVGRHKAVGAAAHG